MHPTDKQAYINRYTNRLKQFGYSPQTLGWGQSGRQEVKFSVLGEPILKQVESSVLDVGCEFADFYDYLVGKGWNGGYHGIDIVPAVLDIAEQRHPQLDLKTMDILDYPPEQANQFDFVVASGVFNAKLQEQDNNEHIERCVTHMFHLARAAVCVDFLSTRVDFQHPTAWHTDPGWAAALANRLSGRFQIRHDYMPFEFSLIVYRDASRSRRNVFTATENDLTRPATMENSVGEND